MTTLALTGSIVTAYDRLNPFEQAVAGYFSKYQNNPATLRAYQQDLKVFFAWCERAEVPPMLVKRFHIEMFLHWCVQQGWSESTVARRITAVHGFYSTAVDDELLDRDPSRAVKAPRVDHTKQRRTFLTPNEFSRFMEYVIEHVTRPNEAALLMILGTRALRIAEACSLNVENWLEMHGERCIRYIGKGGKAMEQFVPPVAWRFVDAAIDGRTTGPILLNRYGNRMTRANAGLIVKRVAAEAGVNCDVSPHSIRRSFITYGLSSGEDIYGLQQTVGHSQITTTARYDRLAGSRHKDRAQSITSKILGMAG